MKKIVGIDFSMSKPAACIYINSEYFFYSWPKELSIKNENIFKNAGINISKRIEVPNKDVVKYDIINSDILSDLIIKTLIPFLDKETNIAFEGSSFASRGNATLSITAWRYILIYKLSKIISLDNIFHYAPITIKKTAGCSQKGKKKEDMIKAFIESGVDLQLRHELKATPEKFQKRTGTWIEHLDDLVDAYWAVETFREKNSHLF